MKYEIKHSYSGNVIYIAEINCDFDTEEFWKKRLAVLDAIRNGVDLSDANLIGADLSRAYLRGAYLRGADLSGADLSGAKLSGANLRDADLSGAYLRDADLSGAYLRDADLSDANLIGADLRDADLSGAYLRDADLSDANLIGADLYGAIFEDANADIDIQDSGKEIKVKDFADFILFGSPTGRKTAKEINFIIEKYDGKNKPCDHFPFLGGRFDKKRFLSYFKLDTETKYYWGVGGKRPVPDGVMVSAFVSNGDGSEISDPDQIDWSRSTSPMISGFKIDGFFNDYFLEGSDDIKNDQEFTN